MNAHIQGLWLFLLTKKEVAFFFFQWFSLVIIATSIYGISRQLHFSKLQSLFCCVIFLTTPVALLQTYSSQQDLPLIALLSIFIYLLVSYLSSKSKNELIFALLSLALALGVKQTGFIALPILLVWLLFLIMRNQIKKQHLIYLPLLVVFFLVFSSYKYLQNMVEFKSFFGVDNLMVNQPTEVKYYLDKAKYNLPRLAYNFIDFGGLSKNLEIELTEEKAKLFRSMFSYSTIDLESDAYLAQGFDTEERFSFSRIPPLTEDTAWLGPLHFLIIPISSLMILRKKRRDLTEYLIFSCLFSATYILGIFLQRPGWDPYQGRYFILAMLPFTPLYGSIIPQKRIPRAVVTGVFWIIFLVLSFRTLTMNNTKPLITARTISNLQNHWILDLPEKTRVDLYVKNKLTKWTNQIIENLPQRKSIYDVPYYEQLFFSATSSINDIEFINNNIHPDQTIYFMGSRDPLEYALFGKNQTRRVYPIIEVESMDKTGYLVFEKKGVTAAPNLLLVDSNDRYSIFTNISN